MLEQPGFSREIDPKAVSAYLAFNSIPAPLTIFAEARKLPPGHLLAWEGGEVELRRYARPGAVAGAEPRRGSADELAAELREVLDDSVRAHLVADVPVGVLLSGGVDSGGLAALAARHAGEPAADLLDRLRGGGLRRALPRPPRRRALRHRPPRAGPPPRRGRAAAEAGRGLRRALRRLLGAAHLPRLRSSPPGRSRSPLSGEGGDELFGGYYTYVADLLARRVGRLAAARRGRWPRRCRAATTGSASTTKPSASPAPRRCRRWSATTPGRRSSRRRRAPSWPGAARLRLGPGRPLPRALRRNRRRRAAGADAGRRPRHLPGRRPAGQDRPAQHGPLAGAAGPLPRPRRSPSSPSRCRGG